MNWKFFKFMNDKQKFTLFLLLNSLFTIYATSAHYHLDFQYHNDIECEFQQTGFVQKLVSITVFHFERMRFIERIFYYVSSIYKIELVLNNLIRGPPLINY